VNRSPLVLLLAGLVLFVLSSSAWAQGPPVYLGKWGSTGTGPAQFDHPYGIAVDGFGLIYVTDQHNFRVQILLSNGFYVGEWSTGFESYPTGITVGPTEVIYVVMNHLHVVEMYNSGGTHLGTIGGPGHLPGQFYYPTAVATDAAGNVYVADSENNRVQKFTAGGAFLKAWGSSWDSGGMASGEMIQPYGIVVDRAGVVFVSEYGGSRVQMFDTEGAFLGQIGSPGNNAGQFDGGEGVVTDADGHLYACDTGHDRVMKFATAGAFLTQWGTEGTGNGQFRTPSDVVIDQAGNILVVEWDGDRVQVFGTGATPAQQQSWGELKSRYR
jgi:tripartite motif-containing protein 71